MGPSKDLSWAMALQLGLPNEIHTSNLSWSHSWCLLISYWDCTIQIWECSVNFPSNQYLQKNISYTLLFSFVLQFRNKHILSLFCHSKTSRRLLYVSENGFSHSMASSMINKRIKDGIWGGFPQISPGHWEDWAGRLNVIIKSQAQQAVPWGGTQRCVKLEDLPVPPIYGHIHRESEDRVIDF